MGEYIEYKCDECGYEYVHDLEIFWIDSDFKVNVAPMTFSTSTLSSKALVSGHYTEYYCYNCEKFSEEFVIYDNRANVDYETIFRLIEEYDDKLKIIKFDDKFQKCLKCGKNLNPSQVKFFSFDNDENFGIDDYMGYDFEGENSYQFWGVYYGYYCNDCRKQINKFVIRQNNAGLTDEEIRNVLNDHTNDLTIFISYFDKTCPDCGGNVKKISQFSICPKCGEGILMVERSRMID